MSVRTEIAVYVVVFAGAFAFTRFWPTSDARTNAVVAVPASESADQQSGAAWVDKPVPVRQPTRRPREANIDLAAERRMTNLRNAVIEAAAKDMYERGTSVVDCTAGIELGGLNKLRLGARVTATAREATIAGWRFIEIVDGEALPPGFGPCAERAFGGPHHVTGAELPVYDGELEIIYFLPATSR